MPKPSASNSSASSPVRLDNTGRPAHAYSNGLFGSDCMAPGAYAASPTLPHASSALTSVPPSKPVKTTLRNPCAAETAFGRSGPSPAITHSNLPGNRRSRMSAAPTTVSRSDVFPIEPRKRQMNRPSCSRLLHFAVASSKARSLTDGGAYARGKTRSQRLACRRLVLSPHCRYDSDTPVIAEAALKFRRFATFMGTDATRNGVLVHLPPSAMKASGQGSLTSRTKGTFRSRLITRAAESISGVGIPVRMRSGDGSGLCRSSHRCATRR
jgi:hypothetical protein